MSATGAYTGGVWARERSRLAGNLSGLRAQAGLSREELAFMAMTSPDRLARIEEEARLDTGLDVWGRIAGALEVVLADLWVGVIWRSEAQRFLVVDEETFT